MMKPSYEDQPGYLLNHDNTDLQYAYRDDEANGKVVSTGFCYR